MSGVAFPDASFCEVGDFLENRNAGNHLAVRPAKLYHELSAVLVITEVDDCFLQCLYGVPCTKHSLFIGMSSI